MDDITSGALVSDPETRRALQLDALSAILPMERRDRLAELLTDDDVATLKHLAREGMGENTLRALASDLAYLEGWAQSRDRRAAAVAGAGKPGAEIRRAPPLGSGQARDRPATRHAGRGRGGAAGGLAASQRRAARAIDSQTPVGELGHACIAGKGRRVRSTRPVFAQQLRLAVRANTRPRQRKSKRAVTRNVLDRLLATCRSDRLADTRDLAILLLAFASGGRRRSEVARLRVEQISDEPAVPRDPKDPQSPTLPCVAIQLGRTKTGVADEAGRVLLVGPPVEALREWLERADIARGPIFRAIDRWEAVEEKALTPQSINLIVKRRCVLAGLEPREFSAHGLRSGYLTEAAQRGVSLPEAMQQSQHRSVQQAASYYNEADRQLGQSARLGV